MAACSHKQTAESEEQPYGVSDVDSLSILKNTDEVMALLHDNNVDEALGKLYVSNKADTTVSHISDSIATQLRNRNNIFPVKSFSVKEAKFRDPLYNAVVYEVVFGDPSADGTPAPTTKMAFNIINLDGTFYVTIMDSPSL